MLASLTILLLCQLAGTALQEALNLPVPGPVMGMALLFIGLMVWGEVPEPLHRTARGLLDNLGLLFVPAGVGIMQQWGLLGREWLPIAVALVASTLIAIAATGALMQWLSRPPVAPGREGEGA